MRWNSIQKQVSELGSPLDLQGLGSAGSGEGVRIVEGVGGVSNADQLVSAAGWG